MTYYQAITGMSGEDSWLEEDDKHRIQPEPYCGMCGGNMHPTLNYCTACGKHQIAGHVTRNPGLVENYRRADGRSYVEELSFHKSRRSFDSQRTARKVVLNSVLSIIAVGLAVAGIHSVPEFSQAKDVVLTAFSDGIKDDSAPVTIQMDEPYNSQYQPVSYESEPASYDY